MALGVAPGAAAQEAVGIVPAEERPVDTTITQIEIPNTTQAEERVIDFEARELSYDSESDVVTAHGDVILRSEDDSVRADEVRWDQIGRASCRERVCQYV